MKKIIAAAVATAFIAPAAFAEGFGVSGFWEYQYINNDGSSNELRSDDMSITFKYAEELENGLAVSAAWTIENDANATAVTGDGGTLAVSGGFGSVSLGDNTGPADSVGGFAVAPGNDGSLAEVGGDTAFLYKAPVVAGFAVQVGTSMETTSASTTAGLDSAAVSYTLDGLKVAYGIDRTKDAGVDVEDSVTAISYAMGGVYFAYAVADRESDADTADATGLAVTYTLNDIKIGYQKDKAESAAGVVDEEYSVIFGQYTIGGGLSAYAEMKSVDTLAGADVTDEDTTTVGVQYKF